MGDAMPGGILTLDMATKLGWAAAAPDAVAAWPKGGALFSAGEAPPIHFGTKHFKAGDGVPGQLLEWLEGTLETFPETRTVVMEAPFYKHPVPAARLQGMKGVVEAVCARRGLRCFEVAPATLKKHFAGHGRADKDQMMKMARVLGFDPPDDNSADAIALMDYAIAIFAAAKGGGRAA